MGSFGKFHVAAAMRDAIEDIATKKINQLRPEPRIAQVVDINPTQLTAEVSFAGDEGSIQARYGVNLQPRSTDAIVRVAGKAGNYYITEVLNEEAAVGAYEPVKIVMDSHTAVDATTGDTLLVSDGVTENTIDGGSLSKDVILVESRIAAVGSQGQSVELNPLGFYVYGPVSEGSPTYVEFPTEGGINGKPNIISGTLQATTLTVDGNPLTGEAAKFRGKSQLEPGATFIINNSVTAPVATPIVESVVERVVNTNMSASNITGASWYNGKAYITRSLTPTSWWSTGEVLQWDPSTNAVTFFCGLNYMGDSSYKLKSLVRNGQYLFALWVSYPMSTSSYATNMALVAYSATTFEQQAVFTTGTLRYFQEAGTLALDGNDLWLLDQNPSSGTDPQQRWRRFDATLASLIALETKTMNWYNSTLENYGQNSALVGSFDIGAKRFISTVNYKVRNSSAPQSYQMTVSNNSNNAASEEFKLQGGNLDPVFLFWDGTRFRDLTISSGQFWFHKYTTNFYTFGNYNNQESFGYSFYDSVGDKETPLSPTIKPSVYSRWPLKITVSKPPAGVGSRVYLIPTSGSTKRILQIAADLITGITDRTTDVTASAPTVSTFSAVIPGFIASQETTVRTVNSVTTVLNSKNISSPGGANSSFRSWMTGKPIAGTGIPAGATIAKVNSTTSAELSVNATSAATSAATLTVPKLEIRGDGWARITELDQVVLTSEVDATPNAGNTPALRIGDITGIHLRFDGNEILPMSSDSVVGTLTIGAGGAQVNLAAPSGRVEIRATETWFPNYDTSASAANAVIGSGGKLFRSSSTIRGKDKVTDLAVSVEELLKLRPRQYRSKLKGDNPEQVFVGFIAEEADRLGLNEWVDYDDEGAILNFHYGSWTVALQAIVRNLDYRVRELESA